MDDRDRRFIACLKRKLGISLGLFHLYEGRPLTSLPKPRPPAADPGQLRFSIVTPSYNQGHFLGETIRSVLDQDYPNIEYVIQDALSTDGTPDVIAAFKDSRLRAWFEKDAGQADAINRGFSRTSGDIMAYLNSDDLFLPGALKQVAAYFSAHPDVDAVYADRAVIDERSAVVGHWRLPPHNASVIRLVDYVPQETLFWRRSLWDRVGGKLDDALQFAMDWDLILRFQARGARIDHLPIFTGAFRVHSGQKTQAAITTGKKEMQRVRRRHTGTLAAFLLRPAQIAYLWRHSRIDARPIEWLEEGKT